MSWKHHNLNCSGPEEGLEQGSGCVARKNLSDEALDLSVSKALKKERRYEETCLFE